MRDTLNRSRALLGMPPLPPRGEDRTPMAELHAPLGPTLPTVLLRLLPLVVITGLVAVTGAGPAVLIVGAVAAAAVLARPNLPVGAWLTVVVGLWLLVAPDPFGGVDPEAAVPGALAPGYGQLALLVLLVHLLVATTGLAAHAPWEGLVELRVLRRTGARLLAAQLPAQALLALLWWWRTQTEPLGSGILRAVAVLAAVGVVLLVLPRREGPRRGWLRV